MNLSFFMLNFFLFLFKIEAMTKIAINFYLRPNQKQGVGTYPRLPPLCNERKIKTIILILASAVFPSLSLCYSNASFEAR